MCVCVYIYSNFIVNIVLFLNIMFWYTHSLVIQSKNILLIIGLIFSVFLGPDEHLQVSECPVAVWSVISEVHLPALYQGCYIFFTPNNSPS